MKAAVLTIICILAVLFFFWQPDVFWQIIDLAEYMAKVVILGK